MVKIYVIISVKRGKYNIFYGKYMHMGEMYEKMETFKKVVVTCS